MTTDKRAIAAALAAAAACAGIAVAVVLNDSPAQSAAANAIKPAAAQPGVPVPQRYETKPVEESPNVADTIPRDGTWIIGKEIKRGAYRTAGGTTCFWTRLQGHPSGGWVIVDGAYRTGPQTVALSKEDVAFASQGCPAWVLVR